MEISEQLEQLLFGESASEFKAIESGLGGFCPFEAIGMINQEIKHSNYLAYLLQPSNLHGFGDAPLRKFLQCAADASGEINKLEIYTRDLADVTVRREWSNIDLLIELPASDPDDEGWVIAVEVKVDAKESVGQLAKYAGILENTYLKPANESWKVVHIFLTLDGRLPSEENQELWAPMGFRQLVAELAECTASTSSTPSESRSMLVAYINMLRRHHLNDPELEGLAKQLWKKHPEALNFLAERRPNPINDFKTYLRDNARSLAKRLSDVDGIPSLSFDQNSPLSNIRFCVDSWIRIDGLASGDGKWTSNGGVLAFELYSGTKGQYLLQSLIGPGDDEARKRLHDAAQTIESFNKWKLGKKWFQLKRWDVVEDLEALMDQSDLNEAFNIVFGAVRDALLSPSGIYNHRQMLQNANFQE